MTSEERKERMKILKRQDDRKSRLPILLLALSKITNKSFSESDVLALDQIDEHHIAINSSDFKFNYLNQSFPKEHVLDLKNSLLALNKQLSQVNYLSVSNYSDIAILHINTDFVINHFEELINLDNDTFRIYDRTYQNGLWIDVFQEYWYLDDQAQFIWIYELRVFGKEWIKHIVKNIK